MTDASKNITLPQTSFAGGKYMHHKFKEQNNLQSIVRPNSTTVHIYFGSNIIYFSKISTAGSHVKVVLTKQPYEMSSSTNLLLQYFRRLFFLTRPSGGYGSAVAVNIN